MRPRVQYKSLEEERADLKYQIGTIDDKLIAFALEQEEPSHREIDRIKDLHKNRTALKERLNEIAP